MTTLISVNCIVAGGNNMWVPGDNPSKVCNSLFIQSFANAPVNFFLGGGGFVFLGLFLVETHALCFIGICRFGHIY